MKFYCITRSRRASSQTPDKSVARLRDSCSDKDVEFIELPEKQSNELTVDLNETDILYRVSTTDAARQLEKILLTRNPVTFYNSDKRFWLQDNVIHATAAHVANNIPVNKTIFSVPTGEKALHESVKYLGGFPVVVKVAGGSHGVGVIKIDSLSSLLGIIDYLYKSSQSFILREYLPHKSHARLITLGSEVVGAIEYISDGDDIRTNSGNVTVEARRFDDEINQVAVDSVGVMGLEFGGVDLIIDQDEKPHLLEVNFPCFFPRVQDETGVDISGLMLDFLIKKAS